MKRLLTMLLAAAMCFSLVACAAEEENVPLDSNLYDVVEITEDNWQDYFEIIEVPAWEIDDSGEILDCYGIITSICLKEAFAERVVSEKTILEFEYTALRRICFFEADLATQEIKFDAPDVSQDEEIDRTTAYKAPSKMKDSEVALYRYTSAYPVIAHLLFSATGYATYRLENVNFTNIEGRLVFEK